MPMKNPPHPGLSVRLNCLEPFGLSVTEGAKALGVSRTALSRLINGQAAYPRTWLSDLPRPSEPRRHWIRMQAAYDLAQARQHEDEKSKAVPTPHRRPEHSAHRPAGGRRPNPERAG